ncbi:hypothetical protein [Solimicrobium silvestre]|uniref:Uncharacterized protein n=1 Tax=Solimicrobium silvestre TaxID=2099400 RepID=A0A2S9GTN3_9BURK|nr:hypothetical protein [Solimicrobium silvestre]PRC91048.1 hypothetical protein S2091_4236 [Solimicrobium silvestre]
MNADSDIVRTHVVDERSDMETELAVNRGLAVALLDGVREGVKIMQDEGVPIEICSRVLKNKANRRASDWK